MFSVELPPEELYEAVVVELPSISVELFFDALAASNLNYELILVSAA
jgi:hypothetical protein